MTRNIVFTSLSSILILAMLILSLSGCGSTSTASVDSSSGTVTAVSTSSVEESDMFTSRDCDPSYDDADASHIVFSDSTCEAEGSGCTAEGSVVTITEEGTYVISGSTADGQIVVTADETAKVQLVLDGLTMSNDDNACILVTQADKVFITLADGTENSLSDSGTAYSQTIEDTNIDAVIFSKATLTFNGTGSLTVDASANQAIVSKDDLKFTGGNYTISSTDKALVGKDSIRIKDGSFTITAGDDGLHSDHEDADKGFVYIEGGTLSIASGDDGIHATNAISILGGVIDITESYEGIEALAIDINGGEIHVTASDDGLNASGGSNSTQEEQSGGFGSAPGGNFGSFGGTGTPGNSTTDSVSTGDTDSGYISLAATQTITGSETAMGDTMQTGMGGGMGGMMMDVEEDAYLRITGGEITVNAGGDGLDSNGYLYIDGGTVTVYGPTNSGNGSIDYGVEAVITGGTVMIAGSSGMAETFGENSTQYSIMCNLSTAVSGGTEVTLKDSNGNTVLSFTPEKDFQNIILSSPDLAEGTYTLTAGSESQEIEVTSICTTVGSGGMGMGGGMINGGNMGGGMMPGSSGDQSGTMNSGNSGMTPPSGGSGMGPGGMGRSSGNGQ